MNADVITRRVHRNAAGDWKKVEKLSREIILLAEQMEKTMAELVKQEQKLKDLQLEGFRAAPIVDSLFMDSPVAPHRQTQQVKMYLKKLGWGGSGDVITPTVAIESFSKTVKDSCRWLMKFKDEAV